MYKSSVIVLLVLTCHFSVTGQSPSGSRCPYKDLQVTCNWLSDSAGNFSIRTTDGMTRNLYNTLDSGKTVFIDLFYTTCSWCQYYAPVIEEIYQNHGAGEGNIVFWGISNKPGDYDSIIDQYRWNYNITNPCAGPQGGGTTAHTVVISGQNFQGWPTYCVICPDRTMFFDPCYPPTVSGFDPFFGTCASLVGTNTKPVLIQSGIQVFPNPANDQIFLQIPFIYTGNCLVEIYNMMGSCVLSSLMHFHNMHETSLINISALPEGTYFISLLAKNHLPETGKFCIAR